MNTIVFLCALAALFVWAFFRARKSDRTTILEEAGNILGEVASFVFAPILLLKGWIAGRLKIYDESLLTRRVELYINVSSWAILMLIMTEGIAWVLWWQELLPTELALAATFLATGFIVLIVLMDITIMTVDSKRKGKKKGFVYARGLFLLLTAAILALAFEQIVLHNTLMDRIQQREDGAIANIRDRALEEVDTDFEEQIAEAETEAAEAAAAVTQEWDGPNGTITRYVERRAEERSLLLDNQQAELDRLQGLIDRRAAYTMDEASGSRGTGLAGRGPRYYANLDLLERERAELERYRDVEIPQERTTFDDETTRRLDEFRTNRDAAVTAASARHLTQADNLRTAKETRLEWVEQAEAEVLGEQFGHWYLDSEDVRHEHWRQGREFWDKFEEVHHLSSESWAGFFLIWGLRFIFLLPGLAILILKVFAPEEFEEYCSKFYQAKAEERRTAHLTDEEKLNVPTPALNSILAEYNSPEEYYYAPLSEKLRKELQQLREQLVQMAEAHTFAVIEYAVNGKPAPKQGFLSRFRKKIKCDDLIGDLGDEGQHPSLAVINRFARKNWNVKKGPAKVLREIARTTHEMLGHGLTPPEWASLLPTIGNPDTFGTEPWIIDEETLTRYGWVDPDAEPAEEEVVSDEAVEEIDNLPYCVSCRTQLPYNHLAACTNCGARLDGYRDLIDSTVDFGKEAPVEEEDVSRVVLVEGYRTRPPGTIRLSTPFEGVESTTNAPTQGNTSISEEVLAKLLEQARNICPACHGELPPGDTEVCPHCGEPLEYESSEGGDSPSTDVPDGAEVTATKDDDTTRTGGDTAPLSPA